MVYTNTIEYQLVNKKQKQRNSSKNWVSGTPKKNLIGL